MERPNTSTASYACLISSYHLLTAITFHYFFAWNLFFVLTSGCLMSLFVLGPDSQKYHHSGLIAFVLQWSCCNKQPAFCNIAGACAFIYIDESWTIWNPLWRGRDNFFQTMNDYRLGHRSLTICKCRKTNVQISKFELRNILASYSHLNQDQAKKIGLVLDL